MRCPHDKRSCSCDGVDLDYIFNEKNTVINLFFNIVEIIFCIYISISLSIIILENESMTGLYGIVILITMLLCVHWFQEDINNDR